MDKYVEIKDYCKTHRIIAVDFDGCLVLTRYPNIGAPIWKNILKVQAEHHKGSKIILWTNRTGEYLRDAIKFCEEHAIHLDAVNENVPEIMEYYGDESRKISATEYWDDKAVRTNHLSIFTNFIWEIIYLFKLKYMKGV